MTHLGKLAKQLILEHRDIATSETHRFYEYHTRKRIYHTPYYTGDLEVTKIYNYFNESRYIIFDLNVPLRDLPLELVLHLDTEPFLSRRSDDAFLFIEKINEKEIRLFVEINR